MGQTLNKGHTKINLNKGQSDTATYQNPFTPLKKRPQLTQMNQTNEDTVPKLARTDSIYPTLDQSKSFISPDPIDKQEINRCRLPTWLTPWPKESDFLQTNQVKDAVKYVSPIDTIGHSSPSSMESALAYLRSHGESIPNLSSLFQK